MKSSRNDIQIVSLRDFDTIYQGQLNAPKPNTQCDGRLPLIRFSPNLESIFIGNVILEVKVPESKPLFLPLTKTLGSEHLGSWEELWTCQFSACSQYVAITQNPELIRQGLGELLVFEIDMKRKVWIRRFQDICVAQYNRLKVAFHPHRPELVINGWIKGDPDSEDFAPYVHHPHKIMAVTTLLLDLRDGRLVDLGEPTRQGKSDNGKYRFGFTEIQSHH